MDKLGILLINKPSGITSFDIIRRLRKITNVRQIGHAGTLDPFAEGLMQILVGKATKIAQFLTNYDKTYRVKMLFGIKTDTGDSTGKTIAEMSLASIQPDFTTLKEKVESLQEQIPPIYSAIKIDGQRAYKLARNNQKVEMSARPIKVSNFTIEEINLPYLTYKCQVSKGTYIRALSEQIAEMYGLVATTVKLDRLSVSTSNLQDSVSLDELTSENWESYLLPLERFIDCPLVYLNDEENKDVWFGRQIKLSRTEDAELVIIKHKDETKGIGKIKNSILYPKKVFK